jgi:alcohol dehydrogenase class IV
MFSNPVKVIHTNSWYDKVKNIQNKLGIKNPLLVTSNGSLNRNKLDLYFSKNAIFSNILPDPTVESCQLAINSIDLTKFDGIIALGGGSVMDTAKVILAVIKTGETKIDKLLNIKIAYKSNIPSIFIPTTHGTGSEVTQWATIWNMKNKKKLSLSHPDLYPTFAILDYNLVLSLPIETSIITILDALSHSFESIWNKNSNTISSNLAIKAISTILKNIDNFKNNPKNYKIRKELLNASNIAGQAFSNTKTAAAHSISYPLTIHFSIPHGVASSISLVPILKITRGSIHKELENIYKYNNCTFESLIEKINSIPDGLVPFKLSKWGVKKDNLPRLTEQSFTKGRMDNSIVKINKGDVHNILNDIY